MYSKYIQFKQDGSIIKNGMYFAKRGVDCDLFSNLSAMVKMNL